MKNRRSLLVNWTRPRTLRCSTITWCLRAAFSASSRLLGLKGEATRLKTKNISATIVADDKRFYHRIKRTTFSAHTGVKAMTDEQLERGIELIKEMLAQREAEANAKVIEGQAVPSLPSPVSAKNS